nr:MAG: ORF1 [TTV-like mini virus]
MPFYKRKFNFYRRWPWSYRRFRPRRRRATTTFRRKRRTRVRRKQFFRKRLKKLKKLNLIQFQPHHINKCKIKGYLELFQTSYGRISNNYVPYKESYVPPHEPGGGGWSEQMFTLGNLYVQNTLLMNYWTKSNSKLNLCRYLGVKITAFRNQNVDYILTYNLEDPRVLTKHYYPSMHPYKLLLFHHKIVIPSHKTSPHLKRNFKKKFIKPPSRLQNKWYFQSHLANFPLLTFFATACDLQNLYIPTRAINSNITLTSLNTRFFQHPIFRWPTSTVKKAFSPTIDGKTHIFGLLHPPLQLTTATYSQAVYLADTYLNDPGTQIGTRETPSYTQADWGNVFYYEYLTQPEHCFLLRDQDSGKTALQYAIENKNTTIPADKYKKEPFLITVRYNPYKDKGDGNIAYWKTVYDATKKNWEPPTDPDLKIENFPLWILLWGWEDFSKKLNKIQKIDEDAILVIRSKYFSETLPAYVFLNDSFINGQGPYNTDRNDINVFNASHWYPRWKFQKEAIEEILMSGPAVCTNNTESVTAHIKYNFFFKWGGNPSSMEHVYDPNSQPTDPDPDNQLISNEIISPETNIANYLYHWDTRRDMLTQKATERIREIPTNDINVFTAGTTTSTEIPYQIQTTRKEETQEKEKTPQEQLINLQLYNQQLLNRLRQLKMLVENT